MTAPALPRLPAALQQTASIGGLPTTYAVLTPPTPPRQPPIVMLHGWGATAALLLQPAEALAKRGHTVHLIDLPGFGDTPAPSMPWTVFDYTKHVLAYCDHAGLTRMHVIGHSFGGRLGLILASDHADRVDKLVLTAAAGVPPHQSPILRARLTAYKAVRDGLYRVGLRAPADALRTWYNRRYGSADFQATDGAFRETFKAVISADLRPYAARVSRPALLIWGDHDADTPLWMGWTLEGLIPDAGLIVFPGAGHYAYLEQTAEFVRIVDHFFTH